MKRSRLFSLITSLLCFALLQLVFVSLFFLITPNWWESRIVNWLQTPETLSHSDAIIVLGGDTVRRAHTGVELFQAEVASRLVITGDNPQPKYRDETEQAQAYAIAQGVPQSMITVLPSTSTFEDAQQISQFIHENNLNQVIVVSDWFHARRAMCSIRQALGNQTINVLFRPALTPFSPQNWWQSEDGITTIFTEFVKGFYYIFKNHVSMWNCWTGDTNTPVLLGLWLSSGVLSFGIVFALRDWASHHLLDIPNERSSHTTPIPRGAGLGIVVMTLLPLGVWLLLSGGLPPLVGIAYIATGALIAAVGWIDDHRSLPAKGRLALQFLFAGVLVAICGTVSSIAIPFIGVVSLGIPVGFLICLIWIVGFTNAYNFMDGIDGLAGIQAVVAGMAWVLLLLIEGQISLAFLAGLVVAASLGFLVLNAPPALIFMGDVGSTFLGFTLAALPVLAYQQMQNPHLLITGVIVVVPFAFDSALTMLRRALKRENIFTAHRSHLYQRLIKIGYSHRQVTSLYMVLCMISVLCGLLYYVGSDSMAVIAVIGVIVICSLLAIGVTWLERKRQLLISRETIPAVQSDS